MKILEKAKIQLPFLDKFFSYVENIEDINENLDIIEFYKNKNRITEKLLKNLVCIAYYLKKLNISYPNLLEITFEKTNIDYIKIGIAIIKGYWAFTYKKIWNALQEIPQLKKVVLEITN